MSTFLDFLDKPERAAHHLAWAAENEAAVRADERQRIGSLLREAIRTDQAVDLQRALAALVERDNERLNSGRDGVPRTCGTLIHLLTSLLGDSVADREAA